MFRRGFALGVPQHPQGWLQVVLLAPHAAPGLRQTPDCPRSPL